MHFGLASGCTGLSDLGATYGLSRERIRQIEESALRKLRQTNRSVTLTRHLSRRSGDDGLMIPGRR
jgi:DNA-directed RNA polymerase sigma subunit (sigma70/sigma32)